MGFRFRSRMPGAPRSHQRTRISCYAAPDRTACAAFSKESRMEFDNATNLDRKSGIRGTKKTGEAPRLLLHSDAEGVGWGAAGND
jgi:hypothetical protein